MQKHKTTTANNEEIPVEIEAQWRLMNEIPLTDWSMVASSLLVSETELTDRSTSSPTTVGSLREWEPETEGGRPYSSMWARTISSLWIRSMVSWPMLKRNGDMMMMKLKLGVE